MAEIKILTTNPDTPRQLGEQDCAKLLGALLGGLVNFTSLENLKGILAELKTVLMGGRVILPDPNIHPSWRTAGDLTREQAKHLLALFFFSLTRCASGADILAAIDLCLGPTFQTAWATLKLVRKISIGEIKVCDYCHRPGHASEACPYAKAGRN